MNYLFTSESVSEGHPDKVADQISDAILDEFLARCPQSKVACETLVTTGQIVIAGEIRSEAYVDIQSVARDVAVRIGYDRSELGFDGASCGVFLAVHEQSGDINRGVDRAKPEEQGAGDQGMMFGYATNETAQYIPLTLDLSHALVKELAAIRHEGKKMRYLRPDSKSQVTVEYDEQGHPVHVDTIVISTQHDEWIDPQKLGISEESADNMMRETIEEDVRKILIPRVKRNLPRKLARLIDDNTKFWVNPTGKFVVGGPQGDTGLTGRKIIVATYGGHGAHGGGAFSGKDPSKVDRSAAYAARHMAKNLVAAGVADRVLVQVAYAIGVARPVSLNINTFGTSKVGLSDSEISETVGKMKEFDMTPYGIEQRLKLRAPIYRETASYGHMGRTPRTVVKEFSGFGEKPFTREVELFTWEKLDAIDAVKQQFGLTD